MTRSLRKGPFVDNHLLVKVEDAQNSGNKSVFLHLISHKKLLENLEKTCENS